MTSGRWAVAVLVGLLGGCATSTKIANAPAPDEVSCASGDYAPPSIKRAPRRTRYTYSALEKRIAGEGRYRCLVDTAGRLEHCDVLQSLGEMDSRVIEALQTGVFEPARCGGAPVKGWIELQRAIEPPHRCSDKTPNPPPVRSREVIKFTDGCIRPRQLSGATPRFTDEAKESGEEGQTIFQCLITEEGNVTECWAICTRTPLMEPVILDALETWKMTPVLCEGRPTAVMYNIPVRLMQSPPPPPPAP